jgi:hypothetical protein
VFEHPVLHLTRDSCPSERFQALFNCQKPV